MGLGDTTQRTTFTQVTDNINNDVTYVACGRYTSNSSHTVILKDDKCIWTCGNNSNGQLGLETSGSGTHVSKFNRLFGFKL